jgi:hypothetical protein
MQRKWKYFIAITAGCLLIVLVILGYIFGDKLFTTVGQKTSEEKKQEIKKIADFGFYQNSFFWNLDLRAANATEIDAGTGKAGLTWNNPKTSNVDEIGPTKEVIVYWDYLRQFIDQESGEKKEYAKMIRSGVKSNTSIVESKKISPGEILNNHGVQVSDIGLKKEDLQWYSASVNVRVKLYKYLVGYKKGLFYGGDTVESILLTDKGVYNQEYAEKYRGDFIEPEIEYVDIDKEAKNKVRNDFQDAIRKGENPFTETNLKTAEDKYLKDRGLKGAITIDDKSGIIRYAEEKNTEKNVKDLFSLNLVCKAKNGQIWTTRVSDENVYIDGFRQDDHWVFDLSFSSVLLGEGSGCSSDTQSFWWKVEYDFDKFRFAPVINKTGNGLLVVPVIYDEGVGALVSSRVKPDNAQREVKELYPFIYDAKVYVNNQEEKDHLLHLDASRDNEVKIELELAKTDHNLGANTLSYFVDGLSDEDAKKIKDLKVQSSVIKSDSNSNAVDKIYHPKSLNEELVQDNWGGFIENWGKWGKFTWGRKDYPYNFGGSVISYERTGNDKITFSFMVEKGINSAFKLYLGTDWSFVSESPDAKRVVSIEQIDQGQAEGLAKRDNFYIPFFVEGQGAASQSQPPTQPSGDQAGAKMINPGAVVPIDPNVFNVKEGFIPGGVVFNPSKDGQATLEFKVFAKAKLTCGGDANKTYDVYINGTKIDASLIKNNRVLIPGLEPQREYSYEFKEGSKTVCSGKFASLSRKQEVNLMYRNVLGRAMETGYCTEITNVSSANALQAAKAGQPLGIAQQGGKWCKDYPVTATETEIDKYDKEIEGGGINYWTNQNVDLAWVLVGIVFDQRYAEATKKVNDIYQKQGATKTVEYIYDKILGRDPDAEGKKFWEDSLDGKGREKLTPRSMMLQVVLSNEVLTTSKDYQSWNNAEKEIQLLSLQNFWRKMEDQGMNHYKGYKSRNKVAADFVRSTEFKSKTEKLSDEQFVESLWLALLGRGIEEKGLKENSLRLQKGEISRDKLIQEILVSDEFRKKEVTW